MLMTNLVKEYQLLLDRDIFSPRDVRETLDLAYRASFLTRGL